MRKVVVISLVILFALMSTVYFLMRNSFSPMYDKRLSQHPLANQSCILVYRNAGGGAMTGYSHAFFIVSSCNKGIDDGKPFLNTDNVNYSVIHSGDNIKIVIDGSIYNVDEDQLETYQGDIIISENESA